MVCAVICHVWIPLISIRVIFLSLQAIRFPVPFIITIVIVIISVVVWSYSILSVRALSTGIPRPTFNFIWPKAVIRHIVFFQLWHFYLISNNVIVKPIVNILADIILTHVSRPYMHLNYPRYFVITFCSENFLVLWAPSGTNHKAELAISLSGWLGRYTNVEYLQSLYLKRRGKLLLQV